MDGREIIGSVNRTGGLHLAWTTGSRMQRAGRSTAGRPDSAGSAAGYDRIIATLDQLALRQGSAPWGVRELADVVGESRSSVNRVLMSLAELGLADRADNGNYRAGPRLKVLADRILRSHPLLLSAGPIIAELSMECEATAVVAVHDWPHPRCFVASNHAAAGPVRYNLDPGTVLPLHAGAAGQAILAELGIEVLDEQLTTFTPDTITDPAQLNDVIEQTRERGYAISVGQHFPLAAGVAVAFRTNGLLAALSITRPRYNTDLDDLVAFAPLVEHATRDIAAAARRAATSPTPVTHTPADDRPAGRSAVARLERISAALAATPQGLVAGGRALGRQLATNHATAAKLIDTATRFGLAAPHADRYMAGPRLLHWAATLGPIGNRTRILEDIVRAVAAQTGETVGLAEYDAALGRATMSVVASGTTPLQYGLATGVDIPLHAGAAGKAILAHLPEPTIRAVDLKPWTERTIRTKAELEKQLRETRARGWAIGDGERIPDAFGIAVPYFIDGNIGGALTVTMPRFRSALVDTDTIAAVLVDAAQRVTRLLSV
jgi:DNA-binding IclR family transcriptional regulator